MKTPTLSIMNPPLAPFVAFAMIFVLAPLRSHAQAAHEKLTTAAWAALEKGNPEGAITNAHKCIEDFEESAKSLQKEIEKDGTKVPVGKPADDKVKESVFARGPLNDVATCWYIIGEANRQLIPSDRGKIEKAREAYEAARALTHARAWDTNGWFWSPSEAARDRLRKLPPAPTKSK